MSKTTLQRQTYFSFVPKTEQTKKMYRNSEANKLFEQDRAFHQWYRFVLSFPPHLVQEYIERFELKKGDILFDPFCGTGTTIIEAKLKGLRGIGIEANQMGYFASSIKSNWTIDPDELMKSSKRIAEIAAERIHSSKLLQELPEEQRELLLEDSISPLPLHKSLILRDAINETKTHLTGHQHLALAASTVRHASNLHFGPEVGVSRTKKQDADVVSDWLSTMEIFVHDLKNFVPKLGVQPSNIIWGDSRNLANYLVDTKNNRIDAVFTSPPYPNEKDYTRTTRLESVLFGFIRNKADLRNMKQKLLRSNSRNIYKHDNDDSFIAHHPEVIRIAETIEAKRIAMGKTSGFEKMYHKVVRQYFGGIARHLESLKPFLNSSRKGGAMLGYVVGDQASFLQVPIPTGKILADIAVSLGYELIAIDLFRTRFATVTQKNMNEEVVVLRWKGKSK
ncbi:MAG: site-specific DNA-methyltransferase [Planctomycetaceae bacterium]|jgi:hypothetical protein|nr:site-specific DNA-methyltransferase [Planctomycetaceae bacterium]